MRVFLALVLVLGLGAVVAMGGSDHDNATEKKASDEITISQPVKIADKTLPAGRYRITCDKETIVFERVGARQDRFEFPCKGKDLGAKAGATELHLSTTGGEPVVSRLLLRGSNIEHVF